jgi:hypothetical protein
MPWGSGRPLGPFNIDCINKNWKLHVTIDSVRTENCRPWKDLTIPIDAVTPVIGHDGALKSPALRALGGFFHAKLHWLINTNRAKDQPAYPMATRQADGAVPDRRLPMLVKAQGL